MLIQVIINNNTYIEVKKFLNYQKSICEFDENQAKVFREIMKLDRDSQFADR